MGRTNKKYDEDYKKNIIKLVENGKPISDIEREYGINRKNIYNWKYKYGTITTSDGDMDLCQVFEHLHYTFLN